MSKVKPSSHACRLPLGSLLLRKTSPGNAFECRLVLKGARGIACKLGTLYVDALAQAARRRSCVQRHLIVQPDATKGGGISEKRRIAWMAHEQRFRLVPPNPARMLLAGRMAPGPATRYNAVLGM